MDPSQDFSLRPHVLLWPLSPALKALNELVNEPNLAEPLRLELADLLTLNSEKFYSDAEKFTLQFGVPRPT